jgi:ketosteroid isomerase-like protein
MRRMPPENTEQFVNSWVSAWNTHDIEAVLAHFAEDVTFASPVAARVLGGDGVVRGTQALRAYWTEALGHVPDLHFEVVGSYTGVDCLVIHYRNQAGGLVNEVLVFDGPLVTHGYGTYLTGDPTTPAGIATD